MLIANAGNANAFTGARGLAACSVIVDTAASALGCKASEIFVASTGAIGEVLDPEPIASRLPALVRQATDDGWDRASRAILTTDTFAKMATGRTSIAGVPVTINGIAKGAGMIAPDMATMLSFVVTDAAIESGVLQALLKKEVDRTFNAITVDSDTSTNDTVLMFATGAAAARGAPRIASLSDPRLRAFRRTLSGVLKELALQIVRDGEGSNKLITVNVRGARSAGSAKRVAMAIAQSPRLKISMGCGRPNWGRVVMAVGKAGEPADKDQLSIWFGDIAVAISGEAAPGVPEATLTDYMNHDEICITVDLGVGRGTATVWTSALTTEYVEINSV